MPDLKIGDIVSRKSYGGDVQFVITDIRKNDSGKKLYIIKGLLYRIEADAMYDDLILQNTNEVYRNIDREMNRVKKESAIGKRGTIGSFVRWLRGKPGRILQLDSSRDFLNKCIEYYKEADIGGAGYVVKESEQPDKVAGLLEKNRPDILVLTGHDSLKKNSANKSSLDSYSNSRYYINAVKVARRYEPNPDKLFIFAGACQSFYEAIMEQGANFASSPGRILIHALDPAIITEKIALTDSRITVKPSEAVSLTKSGSKGIGGKDSKGQFGK